MLHLQNCLFCVFRIADSSSSLKKIGGPGRHFLKGCSLLYVMSERHGMSAQRHYALKFVKKILHFYKKKNTTKSINFFSLFFLKQVHHLQTKFFFENCHFFSENYASIDFLGPQFSSIIFHLNCIDFSTLFDYCLTVQKISVLFQ